MTHTHIADTIAAQMGGYARMDLMLGDAAFVRSENGLVIHFTGSRVANCCEIELTPEDTYRVAFSKIRGIKILNPRRFDGIYANGLKSLFERQTGLYLSL